MNWDEISDIKSDPNVIYGSVVGVSFIEDYPQNLIRLLLALNKSGSLSARIVRNPDNKYDSNACEVWVDQSMIGHIAKDVAAELAPKLDSGVEYKMTIVSIGFANNDPSKPGASFKLRIGE